MEDSQKENVLILVKTYPHRSAKYIETVCTAGIREDGSWIRIFPVPYRLYTDDQQFGKYQWIECSHYKAKDPRPESHHVNIDLPLVLGDKIGTQQKWEYRRRAVLDKAKIYTRFSELSELVQKNEGSLAIFHPRSVKLHCERAKDGDEKEPTVVAPEVTQLDLFHETEWRADFKRVEPIPYDFKYEIEDADGVKATHKILDWELGTLFYWEKLRRGSIEGAKESVKQKYGVEFLNRDKVDLHLYMGTMLQFQQRHMPNPWTIIGVAPFPKVESRQGELGL